MATQDVNQPIGWTIDSPADWNRRGTSTRGLLSTSVNRLEESRRHVPWADDRLLKSRSRSSRSHLTLEPIGGTALERRVRRQWVINRGMGRRAGPSASRPSSSAHDLDGRGTAGDTTGKSPGIKWVALNAIGEQLGYGCRHSMWSNHVQRAFEDTALKQRALELVMTL